MERIDRKNIEAGVEIFLQIIDQLKEILMELHCFMRISYLTDTEFPIVIECIDSAPVLERIWSNKLVAEEL